MKHLVLFLSLSVMLLSSCMKTNDNAIHSIERGTSNTLTLPKTNSSSSVISGKSTPLSVTEPVIPNGSDVGLSYQVINGTAYYTTYVTYRSQWIDTLEPQVINPNVYETFALHWYDLTFRTNGTTNISEIASFLTYQYDIANPTRIIGWVYNVNIPAAVLPGKRVANYALINIQGLF